MTEHVKTAFEKFEELARRIVQVPKAEADSRVRQSKQKD